jgi:hypothetical protein
LGWVWHAPPADVFSKVESVILSQRRTHTLISASTENTKEQGTGRLSIIFGWASILLNEEIGYVKFPTLVFGDSCNDFCINLWICSYQH